GLEACSVAGDVEAHGERSRIRSTVAEGVVSPGHRAGRAAGGGHFIIRAVVACFVKRDILGGRAGPANDDGAQVEGTGGGSVGRGGPAGDGDPAVVGLVHEDRPDVFGAVDVGVAVV